MVILIIVWFVILVPLAWLTFGCYVRRPRSQSVLRIRILATLGALVQGGRAKAAWTWRQKDLAEMAHDRRADA